MGGIIRMASLVLCTEKEGSGTSVERLILDTSVLCIYVLDTIHYPKPEVAARGLLMTENDGNQKISTLRVVSQLLSSLCVVCL